MNSLTVTNCLDSIPCGIECQGVICAALDTIYTQLLQPLATFCMGDQMRRHQRRLTLISVVLLSVSLTAQSAPHTNLLIPQEPTPNLGQLKTRLIAYGPTQAER